MTLLFLLLVWHALADFPLQGDYLAKRKNRSVEASEAWQHHADWPYLHSPWWWHMSMHALIHAGGVAWLTDNIWFGLAEFVLHWVIDALKIEGKISSFQDQLLHVTCKVSYVIIIGVWL